MYGLPQTVRTLQKRSREREHRPVWRCKTARVKCEGGPGDVPEMECTLVRRRGPVGTSSDAAKANNKAAYTAELIFAADQD